MAARRFSITSIEAYEDGRSFGAAGSYEVVRGVLECAVDPTAPEAARIVDLALAARDDAGDVWFDCDVVVLRPRDSTLGNRRLVYSVANRGSAVALPFSLGAFAFAGTSDRIVPGDGFLLERGSSVAWSGWQWDVAALPGMVGLRAPEALGADGSPIAGPVRMRLAPPADAPSLPLAGTALIAMQAPFAPASDAQHDATLTARDRPEGVGTVLPRASWRFDGESIELDGGFRGGLLYDVVFRTERCPVVGAGLLAVRDVVSWLRHGAEADANPLAGRVDQVCATGVSQSGRFLRQFLFDVANVDEEGRAVFDGVHAHIAGGRRGEFNCRYGQPGVIWRGPGDEPPFSTDELLQPARDLGVAPRVLVTNSAAEYWRGDAWLAHGDAATGRDREDPDEVRHYSLAGVDHVGPLGAQAEMFAAANPPGLLDATPMVRALFLALEQWAGDGVEPPPSSVPRVDDGTAVPRADALARLRALPGVMAPDVDALPGHGLGLPTLVSEIDRQGNEVAGIRLPSVAVPVAAFLGWNARPPIDDLPTLMPDFIGSRIPFGERVSASLEGDRDAALRVAAEQLVAQRFLLPEDVEVVVATAAREGTG